MQISEGISRKTNRFFLVFLGEKIIGLNSAIYIFVHLMGIKKDLRISKCLKNRMLLCFVS